MLVEFTGDEPPMVGQVVTIARQFAGTVVRVEPRRDVWKLDVRIEPRQGLDRLREFDVTWTADEPRAA